MRNYEDYLKNAIEKTRGTIRLVKIIEKNLLSILKTSNALKLNNPYKDESNLRGYVGITTGWRPSFILLLKSNSTGSSELLDERYEIVKEINKFRN